VETNLQSKPSIIPHSTYSPNLQKSLQLLEYLIKHGSERVVDDARSHISTIKMLRNFHYIDDKGKDEGINGNKQCLLSLSNVTHHPMAVRNRSRELVELLADIEKIRTERRKAKANKHKYTGTGNDGMGMSFGGGRYGGFGNDSLGGGGGYSGNGGGSYDRGAYSFVFILESPSLTSVCRLWWVFG